jgi:hypothetical protein
VFAHHDSINKDWMFYFYIFSSILLSRRVVKFYKEMKKQVNMLLIESKYDEHFSSLFFQSKVLQGTTTHWQQLLWTVELI